MAHTTLHVLKMKNLQPACVWLCKTVFMCVLPSQRSFLSTSEKNGWGGGEENEAQASCASFNPIKLNCCVLKKTPRGIDTVRRRESQSEPCMWSNNGDSVIKASNCLRCRAYCLVPCVLHMLEGERANQWRITCLVRGQAWVNVRASLDLVFWR